MYGRGRGRGNPHHARGRGRSYGNIGGLVNQTTSDIVRLFLLLSPPVQQDVLALLGRIANVEVHTGDQVSGGDGVGRPDTRDRLPQPSTRGGVLGNTYVKAWDRPIVRDLEAAKRQAARTKVERISPDGRTDSSTLSAALAALNRAKIRGIPEAEISATFGSVEESVISFGGLWPRQARLTGPDGPDQGNLLLQEAVIPPMDIVDYGPEDSQPPDINNVEAFEVEGINGFVTVVTGIFSDISIKEEDQTVEPTLLAMTQEDAVRVLPDSDGLGLGGTLSLFEGAVNFGRGVPGNYARLRPHVRYRSFDGLIVFQNVPESWANSPATKKRRRS